MGFPKTRGRGGGGGGIQKCIVLLEKKKIFKNLKSVEKAPEEP